MDRPFDRYVREVNRRAARPERTSSSRLLWPVVRRKQIAGLSFRRQFGVGPFILDFYCPAVRIAIEVDPIRSGSMLRPDYLTARARWLERRGVQLIRVTEHELLAAPLQVAARLRSACSRARSSNDVCHDADSG